MMKRQQIKLLGICGLTALVGSAAAAVQYEAKDITPAGVNGCSPYSINSQGQVAGGVTGVPGGGSLSGFVTGANGEGPRFIVAPGWDRVLLGDINDQGVAVGYVRSTQGAAVNHAVVVMADSTTPVDLGALGGANSQLNGINEIGRAVGQAQLPDGTYQAVKLALPGLTLKPIPDMTTVQSISDYGALAGYDENGTVISGKNGHGRTAVGLIGESPMYVLAMNDRRQIVGSYTGPNGVQRAAASDPDGLNPHALDVPGSSSFANAINRSGRIVGSYIDESFQFRGFVMSQKGKFFELGALTELPNGDQVAFANGINDAGQIAVGSWLSRCYLLTPLNN